MLRRAFVVRRRCCGVPLVLAVLGVALALPAWAQTTGGIVGTISDVQGGVLPGVVVTVRNAETGMERTTVSEPDGRYRLGALPPGTYELKAELQGFTTVAVTGLTLTIGLELRQDLTMKIHAIEEAVTVTAHAQVVETTKSDVSGVVTQQQIDSLPVDNKQTLTLALLLPGTSQDANRPRKVNANVGSGQTFFSSAFFVDGVSNQQSSAGEPRQDFPQGGIREFKVNVSQATAEFGGTTGGVVTIVTKSGTNQLSGEVFEFFRDKSLNAMNTFEKQRHDQLGVAKPDFRRNQYGGSLGGPIVKDHLHFFVASDLTRTRQFFQVNTGKPQFYSALEGTFPNEGYRRMFMSRADAAISSRQTLFARWGWEWDNTECENCGGVVASNAGSKISQRRTSLVMGHTWVLSSRALNEFRFQWAPFTYLSNRSGVPYWPNTGEFPAERFQYDTYAYVFPSLTYGGSGAGRNTGETWREFRDDFSITSNWYGSHTWKFGGASVHGPDHDDNPGNRLGTWTFGTDQPFNPDDPSSIAKLSGPIQFTASFPPITTKTRNNWLEAYVQDEWKPRSNVTLNLGLRYDLQYDSLNQWLDLSMFPRTIPFIDLASRPNPHNLQPRFGLAWDVRNNGKSVVRAAYGHYNQHIWVNITRGEQQNLLQNSVIIRNPSYPDPYQGKAPSTFVSTAPPNITIMANDIHNPLAHVTTAGFSQELGAGLALHVDAVYTRTSSMNLSVNINSPLQSSPGIAATPTVRPLPAWGRINQFQSIGNSKYRALMVRLDKRFAHRYQYLVSYTLAKSDDNLPFNGVSPSTTITDAYNRGLDWGPANPDRRHALVASGAVLLPKAVTVGAVCSFRSTMPFSALAGKDLNGDGAITDYVPGTSRNQGNRNLDLARVNAWRAASGLGPISASQIDSNRYFSLDVRISKAFQLGGRRKLDVISQVFNVLGTDNLLATGGAGSWVTSTSSDSFGRVLQAFNRQQAEVAVRLGW